jgi:hypothetical protein
MKNKIVKGWMLFDAETGNALDMTMDKEIADIWIQDAKDDDTLVVIEFEEEIKNKSVS